jgi:hypothetical protein
MTPRYEPQNSYSTLAAAALAACIALGSVGLVADAFTRHGVPFEAQAEAARTCAHHRYLSERDACAQRWLVERETRRVAQGVRTSDR